MVEFVPAGGGNGKIYDGTVYGSMDGENWFELSSLKNITYKNQADTVEEKVNVYISDGALARVVPVAACLTCIVLSPVKSGEF